MVLQGQTPPAQDKYEMFNEWAAKNGALTPKMQWPAWFDDGLLGAKVIADVQHREAHTLVPFRMILSCKRTRAHPILGPICEKYPACFEDGRSDDWEQLTLTLALLYETTLGLKSFWYPYLRILPEDGAQLPCFWSEHELETFQDEALTIELEEFKVEMNFYSDLFMKIMSEHPHIFPEEYRDPELFMSMFSNVISRCFGTGIDSTSLVPVADNYNHSSLGSTLEILNKSLHRK